MSSLTCQEWFHFLSIWDLGYLYLKTISSEWKFSIAVICVIAHIYGALNICQEVTSHHGRPAWLRQNHLYHGGKKDSRWSQMSFQFRSAGKHQHFLFIKSDACKTQTLLILRIKKKNRALTGRQSTEMYIVCCRAQIN